MVVTVVMKGGGGGKTVASKTVLCASVNAGTPFERSYGWRRWKCRVMFYQSYRQCISPVPPPNAGSRCSIGSSTGVDPTSR